MSSFLSRLRHSIKNRRQRPGDRSVSAHPQAAQRHAVISDIGRVRASNQDSILIRPDAGLWIVADGMGGHAGGADASRIACEAVAEAVELGMSLVDAFEVAHARVRAGQEKHSERQDMGTTLVAVLESGDRFELAWVGDSRVYRYNPSHGGLERLTRDHNIAGRLLAAGTITAEEARLHPQRNILTDCIGQRDGLPTIEHRCLSWRRGDRLLLCTDGLSGEVDDPELEAALDPGSTPTQSADRLLALALGAGGRDNISLILLDAPAGIPA